LKRARFELGENVSVPWWPSQAFVVPYNLCWSSGEWSKARGKPL
jgi:hypothetical protein